MSKRLPVASYELPAGTLGTATAAIVVRAGGSTGKGYRSLVQAGATGEVEWLLTEPQGPTGRNIATWIQDAADRPRDIIVPGGRLLSVRRPAASAGLVGTVIVTVTEERDDA